MEVFRKRLKEARKRRGYTQEDLGKAIGVTGNAICYYESGRSVPSVEQIEQIAELLQVDFMWLLGKELSSSLYRQASKIVNLSEEDWRILTAIHANPSLYNYLLENTEERVVDITRMISNRNRTN